MLFAPLFRNFLYSQWNWKLIDENAVQAIPFIQLLRHTQANIR